MITQIIKLENIESTQTLAKAMANDGAPHGTLIIAKSQSAGRGQFERKWSSSEGGLYFSIILRPHKNILHASQLTIKSAEVVIETLKKLYNIEAKIKSPNDVLAWHPKKKEWLKICGILTESSTHDEGTDWLVLGIGINLNNEIDKALTAAVSAKQILGKPINLENVQEEFFGLLSLRYNQWLQSVVF